MQREQYQLHADVEQRHWWFVARRRIMRALVHEILPPSPETMILDVGCGTGGNLAALAEDYRCVGIDTSSAAIALASAGHPNVQFVRGVPEIQLQEVLPRVRLVMLMDVLEHVADDFELLSELFAHTSPGTYFLLTVPADMELWSEHDESFGHYRRYDMQRFRRIWRDLPAQELLLSHMNSRLYPLIRHLRRRNRRRGRASGDHGTDLSVPPGPLNRILEEIFAAERKKLVAMLKGSTAGSYQAGVSLITIVRRTETAGGVSVITRPEDVAADFHQPVLV
jgi:SAM-dependent methyltransferase